MAPLWAAGPLPYAPAPNDTYWAEQWYLENLDENGVRTGIDINARAAWSISRGAGIVIAIVDDGVELTHPDLASNTAPGLHWNFDFDIPDGNHTGPNRLHGTAVAGLAAGVGGNHRGMTGVAPEATFASWIINNTNSGNDVLVSDAQLAKMFQFQSNAVHIQNHSWAKIGNRLASMSALEDAAISNAVHFGRGGLGVVMVHAAGNSRQTGRNANDDAYISDYRGIAVAAVRSDGRVASYSSPGASILISAPGGELGVNTLFTTDRVGNQGYNQITFPGSDLADYAFAGLGFQGTSGSAPIISGIVALMLSPNPNLTVRDVQHILVQAAYQTDFDDPDVYQTPAGLYVSHNTGYGLVNAATAVDLATRWKSVAPATNVSLAISRETPIPDAGLRLVTTSTAPVPQELQSIIALPSLGVHADNPTRVVPLVYIGEAATPLTNDLTGKAALIRRGGADFAVKIQHAADAGAEFAVVYNNEGTNSLQFLGGTDFAPIPAVSITQQHGEALASLATNSTVQAQLTLATADYQFNVSEPLITEHVRVRVDANHELRGDVRITLVSPSGARSVLQRLGPDTAPLNAPWIYTSTHHFYESSQGAWTVQLSDEAQGATGVVRNVTLELVGVPIIDADADGLDDTWEMQVFGNLQKSLNDDSDGDSYTAAQELLLGTNPNANDNPLEVDLSAWSDSVVRLNWPSHRGAVYEVLATSALDQPFTVVSTVEAGFPRTTWFSKVDPRFRFFTVREKAP